MEFEQNSSVYLYTTFVNMSGESATISGTPTISVYHMAEGGTKTDVNSANMTQLVDSTYFYKHHIAARADLTTYTAVFSATYSDATLAVGNSDFLVIPRKFYKRKGGSLVAKIIKDKVWTEKDKELVLDLIKEIASKNTDVSSLEAKLDNSTQAVKTLLADAADYKESQLSLLAEREKIIEEICQSRKSENSEVYAKFKKIDSLLMELNSRLDDSKMEQILLELDAFRKELDDFKKAFVLTIPTEIIEVLLDGQNK